jgi:catechol 2,3-dioxygenase-like lactoylglutathione lyase family enzyme
MHTPGSGTLRVRCGKLLATLALAATGSASWGQGAGAVTPLVPAHFHHLHLNSTDPERAIDFYTSTFKSRRENFAGVQDGVWTGEYWVLVDPVKAPPPATSVAGLWHFGFGARDMPGTYQRLLAQGTRFSDPLGDISALFGFPAGSGRFYFANLLGPDGVTIEINTADSDHFGHIHLLSADPVAAGAWYARCFGFAMRTEPEERIYNHLHVAPAAYVTADQVNIIIYPQRFIREAAPQLWKRRAGFATSTGRVIDHLGFSVVDLAAAMKILRRDGVKITDGIHDEKTAHFKYAMIEGPDRVSIELIEDHSRVPVPLAD